MFTDGAPSGEKKYIYILLYFIKKVLKYRCCRKKGRKCKHSDEQLTLYCRHFHACFSRLTTIAVINYQQNWHQKHPGQATRRSKNPLQTIRRVQSALAPDTINWTGVWLPLTVKVVSFLCNLLCFSYRPSLGRGAAMPRRPFFSQI